MAMIFLLGVTDTLGHVTYTEYDELNRVKRTWRNYLPGYPQNHQETYNLVTTYGYNPVGNQTHVTDTLGHVTYTEYDALNRPITVTTNYVDGIFDPARPDEDIIQVTVYDPETGQPVAQVDTIGRETRTDYDAAGRPVTVTTNYVDGIYDPARPDEDTQQVTHYDPETGRVTARWQIAEMAIPTRYEYDVLGRRITTTNALSGTTVTHYDALGRRSETIDAEGHVTQYDYDAAGRLIATTNALSGTTVTHYDALGRRVATTDQLGHTTIYTHNAAGQLTAQADPLGNVTHYDYDVLGRRTAITDADGVATTSYYDSLGRLTRTCDALDNCTHYAYNALGNRTVMTDANGIATKYMYNDRGRLVAVIENWQAGGPINEQVNVRTDYAYDISGNLQVITDALGHTTVYTYDLAGRRVAEADPLGNVTEYHYDGHGRRVGEIYPDDSGPITVTTAYDALGRPTEIAYPAVGSVSGFAVEIDYDAMGNRRSVTDATGSTTYDYNALYQPLGIAAPAGDAHYEYDAAGRRTHLIYPTGEVVTYTHNAAGRLRTVTDWDGGVTIYTYTAAGRLSRIELPNGVCTDYSYDDAGRLQRIKHFKGKQLLSLYTYVLDPIGNRTMVTEEMVTEQTITPVGDASVQSDSAATYVGSSFGIQMDGVVSEFRHPDVASLEEDPYINEEQYLSVWLGYPGFGTGPVVYGRTVSSSGAMGTHLIIRNNTSGNVVQYQQPRVAYDPTAGRALVLWKEGDDIYGRLVNMRTTPPTLVGLQPFIVADGNEKQSVNYAAVAAHPLNGNFLVVYERSEASDDVYGQFVTSSGTLEGNAFEIASDALDPDVDFYPNRRQFMVIWETIEDKENPSNIQGRLVEEERLGSIFTVYPSATGQYDPAVSYNAINQRFLVVWDENGIKGRQITTSGGYGSLISISSYGSVPDVGGNGVNGNWLVSWSSFQVYAHEINSSGVLTGDLLTFGIGETSQIIAVSHASPESGRYLTVWGQTDDIMGKLVGPNLVAGFRASPTSGSDPLTVHFTDTTQLPGMADQWLWDFGDGTQSTTQHPEKTYTHPGVYTVQLTATDQDTEDTDSVYLTQGITVVNSEIFETRTITYTYDPLNRLTAADYSTGESFAYAYDAVGNRTAMTDTAGVHTYTYDAANRLTEIQHPDASIETYTWDARGNLIGDGAFTYDYNAAGRMVRADSATSTLVYTYTADGLRVAQSANGDVTAFSWDWATGVPELLSDSDALYLVGHETLGQFADDAWAYYLPDALGSVRQATDVQGAVTAAREWTPYGVEIGDAQPGLGYAGEWFDAEVEAQYLRARWYDVATGRFTSQDPWEGDIYNPETRNGFDYANDNPILFTDPLGLCTYGEPNYIECMQLARLLARAYGQPVGDATGTYDEKYHQYSNLSYNSLQNLWVSLDPVHSQNRYDVVEQEAKRFALPPEFIAAVIAAEVEYDTDWINSVYDVWTTCLDWSQPDCLPLNPFARLHMELWYDYYGLGPLYLNPEHGFGEGPAPGIGNVHVGVAAGAEQYFATNYPDEDLLPIARTKARRLELLRRYKWNVRYVAAYLRQLADTRTGRKGPHPDLTDTDMKMIFVAYHADLAYCFGKDPDPVRNFQDKQSVSRPECKRFADQLGPFLSLYRSGK